MKSHCLLKLYSHENLVKRERSTNWKISFKSRKKNLQNEMILTYFSIAVWIVFEYLCSPFALRSLHKYYHHPTSTRSRPLLARKYQQSPSRE